MKINNHLSLFQKDEIFYFMLNKLQKIPFCSISGVKLPKTSSRLNSLRRTTLMNPKINPFECVAIDKI